MSQCGADRAEPAGRGCSDVVDLAGVFLHNHTVNVVLQDLQVVMVGDGFTVPHPFANGLPRDAFLQFCLT